MTFSQKPEGREGVCPHDYLVEVHSRIREEQSKAPKTGAVRRIDEVSEVAEGHMGKAISAVRSQLCPKEVEYELDIKP